MVAEEQQHYDQGFPHDLDSRSPPPAMMLQDSKFFPGHPGHPGHPAPLQPWSPALSRKDIFNQRKQREFIPENKKDDSYWDRRRRNNEAAKRSREKRRLNDMLLETRVIELSKDNHILKSQLNAIFEKYGIKGENMISMDQVMATMPSNDQVLNFTKKRLGPLPDAMSRESSPNRLTFQSLSLPITINNNNSQAQNRNCSPERSLSPVTSYRSPSPYHGTSLPTLAPGPAYTDMRGYPEQANLYRRPVSELQYEEEDRNSDKDSGLALNLSTDRAGSDGARDESGRSSASGTPPVSSSNIQDGSSSGDESGYPRSPNSSGSQGDAPGNLPHKLRFKSALSEKEAVTSLLSLHQMAMIKREPSDHINNWMESAGSGLSHAGLLQGLQGLGGLLPQAHFSRLLERQEERVEERMEEREEEREEEPSRKRQRAAPAPGHKLHDEVARLTSEVATLKNILVTRMRDEEEEEEDRPNSPTA